MLEKQQNDIELLFSDLFSDLLQKNGIRSLSAGFNQVFFNQTERFRDILVKAGPEFVPRLRGFSDDDIYLIAFSALLQKGG